MVISHGLHGEVELEDERSIEVPPSGTKKNITAAKSRENMGKHGKTIDMSHLYKLGTPMSFPCLVPTIWGLINQTPQTFTPSFSSERKNNMFFTHQLHHTKLPFSLIIFPLFPCFQTTYPHPPIRAPLVNGFAGSIEGSTWQLSKLRNFTTCQKIIWKTSNH